MSERWVVENMCDREGDGCRRICVSERWVVKNMCDREGDGCRRICVSEKEMGVGEYV